MNLLGRLKWNLYEFFFKEFDFHTVSVPSEALLTPPDTGASTNFKFFFSSVRSSYCGNQKIFYCKINFNLEKFTVQS